MKPPFVALVHMPKAGGTTLTDILRSVYGPRLLTAHPLRGWPQQWPPEFLTHIAQHRQDYDAFSGHAAYGIHELFGRETVYLSSVRDPVARFESFYNFVQRSTGHRYHEATKGMGIGEFFRFLRERDDIELFNIQCLMLCGRKDFETARDWVRDRYLAVAPLTRFPQVLARVAQTLGWGDIAIPQSNRTEHKATVTELESGDLQELLAGNAADQALVHYCEDLCG